MNEHSRDTKQLSITSPVPMITGEKILYTKLPITKYKNSIKVPKKLNSTLPVS